MMDIVYPKLNMFRFMMIHKVINNFDGTLIVTKERDGDLSRKPQLIMNQPHPTKMLPSEESIGVLDCYYR